MVLYNLMRMTLGAIIRIQCSITKKKKEKEKYNYKLHWSSTFMTVLQQQQSTMTSQHDKINPFVGFYIHIYYPTFLLHKCVPKTISRNMCLFSFNNNGTSSRRFHFSMEMKTHSDTMFQEPVALYTIFAYLNAQTCGL